MTETAQRQKQNQSMGYAARLSRAMLRVPRERQEAFLNVLSGMMIGADAVTAEAADNSRPPAK